MSLENLQVIESLTEEEKAAVKAIVNEISNNGKSDDLTSLYYEDYEEIPVDLETFLCSDTYLGNYTNHGKDIYETWKKELAYVHNPATFCDQWAITGSTGTGKAQPLGSLIFTPNGYIKMKDIEIGDKIIDGLGNITKVTHIYPQGIKPIYKVTFSDKTSTLCAEDHLWKVGRYERHEKKIIWSIKDTKSILDSKLYIKNSGGKNYKYDIPLVSLKFNEINETKTVDPYLLGVLLGDGCFTHRTVGVFLAEQDIYDKIKDIVETMGYELRCSTSKYPGHKEYNIIRKSNMQCGFVQHIKELNLYKCNSHTKFIPKEYIYTSVENRVRLLQGLIDTDGCVVSGAYHSSLTYTTVSKQLSEDVKLLVQSLGGIDTVNTIVGKYKIGNDYKNTSIQYRHSIQLPLNIKPCTSIKHLNKYNPCNKTIRRRIIDIEYIGEQECQCIVVDSPDHTYLTNDLIVTHNSTVATYSLAYELYKLMCLKNPNRFYLNANETIWILFFNLNLKLAEKTMWR